MNIFFSTSTYGRGFKETEISDQYSIRIYTGGFAGKQTAQTRVEDEISEYIANSTYSSYRILRSRRIWLPFSCYEYIVQFL